jgi:hypothetical protein
VFFTEWGKKQSFIARRGGFDKDEFGPFENTLPLDLVQLFTDELRIVIGAYQDRYPVAHGAVPFIEFARIRQCVRLPF